MNKAELLKKLLSFGSQTAPELIEEAAPLAKRVSTEATEVAPEVIGKGTSKLAKEAAEDIPDAVLSDPKPMSSLDSIKKFAKENPGKIVGGLTLGEMARRMMGGDEQPPIPPFAPKSGPQAQPILPDNYNALAQAEANEQDQKKPELSVPAQVLANFKGVPTGGDLAPEAPVPQEMDFVKMIEAANQQANRDRSGARLVRGSELLGAGLARINPNHSSSDQLRQDADKSVEQTKAKIGAAKDQQAFNKAKDELSDETKMRDPNSEISKMVTSIAQKVGILKPGQSASAMSLKNAGVNLGTLLATIEAGNARRDAAALSRDLRADEKTTAREFKAEEDRKKREDKRKLTTEEIEARKRTIGDNIKRARDIVEKYGTVEATGPQAELLQGMLDEIAVDTAKLQDPDSVARPAEVQLVRQSLIPEDTLGRMTMTNNTAKTILDEFEKRINERAATGYKVRGIEQPASPAKDNNSDKQVVKKQYSASRNQTKLVYSDGSEEVVDGKQ